MKQQASISLKIVDNPIDSKALDNSLLLRATSNGLKLFNNVGEEVQIGNGSSDIQHIFKVTEFPTSGMLDNSIYILESGEVKAYFAEGWIDISQEVVEIIDDSATNNNIPTTKAVKDYIDANSGSSSIQVGDGLTGTGASASPLKLDLSNYSQDGNISITASGDAYLIGSSEVRLHANGPGLITVTGEELDLEAGINFNVTAENINFNSHAKNTAGGFAIIEDSGKLPSSIIPSIPAEIDLSNYSTSGAINLTSFGKTTISADGGITLQYLGNSLRLHDSSQIDIGGSAAWITVTASDITVGNKQTTAATLNAYRIAINIDEPETEFTFNGHGLNTAGGLAYVDADTGKLPSSIIPDVDLSNYYNKTESDEKFALKDDVNSKLTLSVVEDFPTSGINNTLYVNNENHAQIYANDQWKDIAVEVVENFETVNQTTVPTTQAVKDYVDTIQVGPSMKTEATTNAIIFKKDTSIYKIEVANATTFTFDFSQLDENNCYTFELWVSMSTPVTLTFPSDVAWLNDEVPDMSEASTYCIVVRKLPSTMGTSTITSPKALLNLAYQYPLVLG